MLLRNCATASTDLESKTINLRAIMFMFTVRTKYTEIETEFEHLNIFFDSYH